MKQDISEEQLTAFLAELTALTVKHGIEIGGCGCCGSPYLDNTTSTAGRYTAEKSTGNRGSAIYLTWEDD